MSTTPFSVAIITGIHSNTPPVLAANLPSPLSSFGLAQRPERARERGGTRARARLAGWRAARGWETWHGERRGPRGLPAAGARPELAAGPQVHAGQRSGGCRVAWRTPGFAVPCRLLRARRPASQPRAWLPGRAELAYKPITANHYQNLKTSQPFHILDFPFSRPLTY